MVCNTVLLLKGAGSSRIANLQGLEEFTQGALNPKPQTLNPDVSHNLDSLKGVI